MRIVGAKREFSAVAQCDRYRVEARNVIKPAVRCQVNAPAIPPVNANRIASDDLRKPHPLADDAESKRCTQSFILDCNLKSVEQNEANQQDNRNNYWRRVMAYESSASNQNDREKGPNDYVTDLCVLVARHRSLSVVGCGRAVC